MRPTLWSASTAPTMGADARQRILVSTSSVGRQLVGGGRRARTDGEHEAGDQRADRDETERLAYTHPGSPAGRSVPAFDVCNRSHSAAAQVRPNGILPRICQPSFLKQGPEERKALVHLNALPRRGGGSRATGVASGGGVVQAVGGRPPRIGSPVVVGGRGRGRRNGARLRDPADLFAYPFPAAATFVATLSSASACAVRRPLRCVIAIPAAAPTCTSRCSSAWCRSSKRCCH